MSAMKVGSEDKRKLIIAGVVGVLAVGYMGYTFLGSGGDSSAPPAAPTTSSTAAPSTGAVASPAAVTTARVAPNKLDPTLHPDAMLLTESLVYSGNGRNIFLPGAPEIEKQVAAIPKAVASARYTPPAPVYTGPPPPPPIELRFFGTATRRDGTRQAFLLHNEDVFVAKTGDVVTRRYKIGAISANSIEVTDMTNNNTQRLPMVAQ